MILVYKNQVIINKKSLTYFTETLSFWTMPNWYNNNVKFISLRYRFIETISLWCHHNIVSILTKDIVKIFAWRNIESLPLWYRCNNNNFKKEMQNKYWYRINIHSLYRQDIVKIFAWRNIEVTSLWYGYNKR